MSVPAHPLLALVDASKNDLKVSLTNYIDFQVEKTFGQLRNRIVHMIEHGEIVLADVNAPVLPQANTNQANSTDAEDNENVVGNESYSVEPRHAQVSAAAFVQPLPSNHQNDLSVPSIAPSNMNNLDEHLSRDKIAFSPNPPAHPIATEPMIKQEYFEIDGDDNARAPMKEEYDDDEDEGEYISDCDECEHCVDGICQLNLVRKNDNADNDAETGVDNQIGLNQDEIEGEPNASVANDLMADVIDDSNQSSDNANNLLLSLINESEQQIRRVEKLTNVTKQNNQNGQSAQPVTELGHQSINTPSTSGLQSSNRKRVQTKVFDQSTRERNKRESEPESSKAAKRIKHGNDRVPQEDEDGNVVENGKHQMVTLEVNCTEPDCKTILESLELWKQHLVSIHGLVPYKHLKDNVRANQHGQTEYACTECNSMHNSQDSLIRHWKDYHQAGKFECSVCAFVANFRGAVLNHHQKNHRSSKFQCNHQGCNQAFKFMKDFKRHQLGHSGETPFKCTWDNCEASFNQFRTATRHVRTQHFHLPPTVKEQKEQNIIDERDPKVFVQVIGD